MHSEMRRIFRKNVLNVLCQTVKFIMLFSNKIAVTLNSTIQKLGAIQLREPRKAAAFEIMHVCAFSIQIGNHRAYATIPRKELSKNDQDLRKYSTEATIVMYRYFTGSTDLWWV